MEIDHFSSTHDFVEEVVFQDKQHSFSGIISNPLPKENDQLPNMFNNNQNHHHHQQQQEFEVCNFMSLLEDININLETDQQKNLHHKVPIPKPLENNIQKMPQYLSSLEILRNHGSRFNRNNTINTKASSNLEQHQKMSTEGIIRVAGARYTQYSSSHWSDNFCIQTHPYGFDLNGLSEEENRDIELAQFLYVAAERVSLQQYERAKKITFILSMEFFYHRKLCSKNCLSFCTSTSRENSERNWKSG